MKKHALVIAVLIVAISSALILTNLYSGETPRAWAAITQVTAREVTDGDKSLGEVVVNGQVVFRIRSAWEGVSPFDRASRVAERLDGLIADGVTSEQVEAGVSSGQQAVLAKGEVLLIVDEEQARLSGMTPAAQSESWANRLKNVLDGKSADAPVKKTLKVKEADYYDQPQASKIVPIIGLGSGVRVGGAQVSGPADRVAEVKAVAQIEGTFSGSVRVKVLVPVSTENIVSKIARVPGTSVTALVDLKL